MIAPVDHHSVMLRRFCAAPDAAAPSVVLIAAHPDDETIGAAARLLAIRRDLLIVHVTDGSPRELSDARAAGARSRQHYAQIRRHELLEAMAHVGIAPEQMQQLPFIDQETALHLPELTKALAGLLRETQPDVVLTHSYEGGHPDHDAVAFAVHAATHRLDAVGQHAPVILEMTGYHNGPDGITPGEFLHDADRSPITITLTPRQLQLKRRMLGCFVSQARTLEYFTGVTHESFRVAPDYDFTRPPQTDLFYDHFDWGLRSDRWRELAGQALRHLTTGEAR